MNIIDEGVVSLGFEEDIKDHGERIQRLEVDMAGVKEKLNSVEGIVTRFETNYYQTSNSMLQTMSQIVVNTSNQNADLAKTKSTNNRDIIIHGLKIGGTILGIIVLGLFAAKGISVSIPMF